MNQFTKGYTRAEIIEAKRHRTACKISAKRQRSQILYMQRELQRLRKEWRDLIKEARKPLKEYIEYAREYRAKQSKCTD